MAICEIHKEKMTKNAGIEGTCLIVCPADYCFYGNLRRISCEFEKVQYCSTDGIVLHGGKIPQQYITELKKKKYTKNLKEELEKNEIVLKLLKMAKSTKCL